MKAEEGDVRAGPFGEPALFFALIQLFFSPASIFYIGFPYNHLL